MGIFKHIMSLLLLLMLRFLGFALARCLLLFISILQLDFFFYGSPRLLLDMHFAYILLLRSDAAFKYLVDSKLCMSTRAKVCVCIYCVCFVGMCVRGC